MHALVGHILTPQGWFAGRIQFDQHIISLDAAAVPSDAPLIMPGFIDLHVHGGHGADTMEGMDSIKKMASWHARHGTTSLLATTMSAPLDELKRVLAAIRELAQFKRPVGARILGAHLEGPFINADKRGAHPAVIFERPLIEAVTELCDLGCIRVVTLAGEAIGDESLIGTMTQRGIRVQLGHSLATYEEALDSLRHGASGFTHLYNAMSGLQHRSPGLVGAAFAKAEFAEIIPDLFHVHEGAILSALRAIPKLYCVTDASAASGMPDGVYALGPQKVSKCANGVFLKDGTIAGSTLTMDQAFRNLLHIGLSADDAVRRLSTFPADYLGLKDRGRIQIGCLADLVVMNSAHSIETVFVEGDPIDPQDAL